MVTNVNEAGEVTLSTDNPGVGTPIMATLTDLDGDITDTTWQWASSDAMDGTYTDIEDATSYAYTPVAVDAGSYLQATASYTDGHGPGKSKMATTANMVVHLAISGTSNVEYAENGAEMVATYSASGPDAASVTWTLEGDDAGDFAISSNGELTFVSAPDYEYSGGRRRGQRLHGHGDSHGRRRQHRDARRDRGGHRRGRRRKPAREV